MRKILCLLLTSATISLSPCEQENNIRKAFIVVQYILRQAQYHYVTGKEIVHALDLYYHELAPACSLCKTHAKLFYQDIVCDLESFRFVK